jgi:hypothetical protein
VSRYANRAATVAAYATRGHARNNRRSLASTGTAGRALQVPRAVGAAVKEVVCFPRHQELGRVGCAQDNGAGILKARDERRILGRNESCAQAGSGLAAQTRYADRTLDAEWNSVQQAKRRVAHDARLRFASGSPGAFRIDLHEGI